MTLRDSFLQDPFFNSSWNEMEKFREHFFQQSQSMNKSESRESKKSQTVTGIEKEPTIMPLNDSIMSRNWMLPRKWMMPKLLDDNFSSMLDMNDSNLISLKNDDC